MSIRTLGKRLNSFEDGLGERLVNELDTHVKRICANDYDSIMALIDAWHTSPGDRTPEQVELLFKLEADVDFMAVYRQLTLVDWSQGLRARW